MVWKKVKEGFMDGFVTKDEYASILRANQQVQDAAKSDMREKAARFRAEDSSRAAVDIAANRVDI